MRLHDRAILLNEVRRETNQPLILSWASRACLSRTNVWRFWSVWSKSICSSFRWGFGPRSTNPT